MRLSNLILIALVAVVIMLQLAQADPDSPVSKIIIEPIKETALEPLRALIGPMLSNAEKQISELMSTLDVLFTAGEKVAFSPNESEQAIEEIKRSTELLEKQRVEQEKYLEELKKQTGAMLGNMSNFSK